MREHKFDHLILLIGTNPLPNFVVAEYFIKDNPYLKTIWLIHSRENIFQAGTGDQAENLERVLCERWKEDDKIHFYINKVSISDVSNAGIIQSEITKKIIETENWSKARGFHFNYTGGTKSMSTHVYWILREIKEIQKSFSYLDARNFSLVEDSKGVIVKDLRKEISLDFYSLIKLHGFERLNKAPEMKEDFKSFTKNEAVDGYLNMLSFPETVMGFRILIQENKLNNLYEDGGYDRELFKRIRTTYSLSEFSFGKLAREDIAPNILEKLKEQMLGATYGNEKLFLNALRRIIGEKLCSQYKDLILNYADICREDKGLAEKSEQLDKNKVIAFRPNPTFGSLMDMMPEANRLFSEEGKFRWEITNNNFEKTIGFFDGKWFEEYSALILIGEYWKDHQIQIDHNWEFKKPDWPDGAKFELDVILLQGYHLTGISCTTASRRDICKNKGFEIIHRTKQIGGDEAKAILITFMDSGERDELRLELSYETGWPKGNILVLGKEDIGPESLVENIQEFMAGN